MQKYIYLCVGILFVAGCSESNISAVNEEKEAKTKQVDQLDSETRKILSDARKQAPIDTTGLFAYGVLDKGRTKDKVNVGYYNESVYKIYKFQLVDSTWKLEKK